MFVANGLNGFPVLNFGLQSGEGNTKTLTVPDADNLDGGPGISIFLVLKRNEMLADFAAIIQKRDITGGDATKQAWDLEMDAGSNPNKFQFVVARDLFLKNSQIINTDKYYIVNVNYQGALQTASFINDGDIESTNFYNRPIQATNATLILGGFQPMNVAEAILVNSDMNMAQIKLVTNYLAAKYDLTLKAGDVISDFPYKNDLIGIGKDRNITNTADDVHLFSSGGGIELKAATIADAGDYVFAGHNGNAITENTTTKQWSRTYYLKNIGDVTNITLGFDFEKAGLTTVPDNTYKLLYKSTESGSWTDLSLTPVYDAGRKVLTYTLSTFQDGYYTISKLMSTGIRNFSKSTELSVYPNPATDKLVVNIKSQYKGKLVYNIVDLQGRIIVNANLEKGSEAISEFINLDMLAPGTYMLEVIQDSEKEVKMFLKN
ncbi:MAG: T9SS type A sorting domain-containing protein [Bacteroidales bacterium]|nr:T9SS type A sorting domain-containing protein [Bacteroidales bacterium]